MDKNLVKYLLPILCLFDISTAAEDRNEELNLQPKTKLNRLEGQIASLKGVKKEVLTDFVNVGNKEDDYESALDISKYQKVKLIDVVLETLAHSDLLKSAREKVIQFEIKVDDAIANTYPTLDLEYSYGRTAEAPSGEDGKKYKFFHDKNYRVVLRQNIYSGGANEYEIKSVSKKLEVSQNQYRIVLEEEIKKAIKAYFGVVFANRTVIVNERNMKKLNKILQIVTTKYDNGAASIADLTSIKASVANAMTKLVRVKSKFIESIRFYEYIVGGNFDNTLPYEKDFEVTINNFDDLFNRAIDRNRNLFNYYKSIEAEIFKAKNNEALFKPKLDFEVSYKKIFDKEDFEDKESALNTKIKMTYNLFNGGRDKNKVLEVASDIRDLKYRLNEEKKKIKWNLSKLFTSTQSVSQALESTVTEIQASRKAVSAYWDAFKLGEQDLPTLLQGQRQLNSAETELVKFEEDYVSNFFDILELTGDLAPFFDVDPNNLKFIDFSRSSYSQTINASNSNNLGLDLKTGELNDKNEKKRDILKEEEELKQELVIEEEALKKVEEKVSLNENINMFIEKFLAFDDESFMIEISSFGNIYEAFDFIKENKIDKNSLTFDVINNYELKTKVAHNNFETMEEAQTYLNELENKELNKSFEIKKVSEIKELYENYKAGLKVEKPEPKVKTKIKVVEKIMQAVKKKEFTTNEIFKKEFLATNDNKFTINVSTFTNLKTLETLINENSLHETSFFFRYGDNGQLIKLVNGIFDNYVTAEQTLVTISSIDSKLFPVIERVGSVKNLYNENIDFNTKKEEPVEYEYINLSNNTKVKVNKTININTENKVEAAAKLDSKEIEKNYKLADAEFIKRYLDAPRDYYTLNIAAFDSMAEAEDYVDRNYIEKDTILVISNSSKIMVMYGIYASSSDVSEAMKNLPEFITRNKPIVQKIFRTQESFIKNNLRQDLVDDSTITQEKAQKEAEEKARLEAERLEQERIVAEQKALEEQRISQEKAQKEAEEKARLEVERLEQERIAAEQKALEEQRIAQEKAQKEAEEKARLKAEKLEQERIAAEQKALEEQRIAQEKAQKEAEEKAKLEAERLEQERIAAEQKALEEQRIAQEKAQKEAEEKAKLEAERLEQERIAAKQKALEEQRIAQEKAQKEVEEKAKLEAERLEQERIAQEKVLEENNKVAKNKYTIKVGTVDNQKVSWFVYRFSIGNDYKAVKKENNQSDIYFGNFNTNEEALKVIDTLHPRLEPIIVNLGDAK